MHVCIRFVQSAMITGKAATARPYCNAGATLCDSHTRIPVGICKVGHAGWRTQERQQRICNVKGLSILAV